MKGKRIISDLMHKDLSYQIPGAAIEIRNGHKPFNKKLAFASFILALIGGLSLTGNVYAQSLSFSAPKSQYRVGESFQVNLSINTGGQAINTISGIIDIPTLNTPIIDVRYGNSIISLWVEKPTINHTEGLINFAGGIPGGFNGASGPLLSFGLQAKRTGNAVISLKNVEVLLNDGKGTKLAGLTLSPLTLTIREALPPPPPEKVKEKKMPAEPEEVYAPPPDIWPPEPFIPIVSRHPSVADNKYFVSFSAVDKDTGISHYVIREEPLILTLITAKFDLGPEKVEQTPYVLKNQFWPTKISIRAYDQAGNSIEESVSTPLSPFLLGFIGLLIALAASSGTLLILKERYGKELRRKV